jgi:sulfite reductase (ferredoxin)
MYTIYLGASPVGTRLGSVFAQNVKRDQITERLRPIFHFYKETRRTDESFGDFCHRIGIESLRELAAPVAA